MRRFLKSNILSANLLCCCCLSVVEPSQTRKAGIFRIVFRLTLSRFIWMCANVGRFSPVVLSNCTRSCARQPRSSAPTSDFQRFSKDPSPTKWLSEKSQCFCPSTRRRRIDLTKMAIWILRNYFMHGYTFLNAIFTEMKTQEKRNIILIFWDGSINEMF